MREKNEIKDRLKQIASKKFETALINSLAQFENYFGDFLNLDVDEDDLSDEELEILEKWDKCRNKILDIGHAQKRLLLDEIDFHTVERKKHSYEFVPQNKGQGNDRRNRNK